MKTAIDLVSGQRLAKGLWWERAWSLVEGRRRVSAGCDLCWAAAQARMRRHNPSVAERYRGVIGEDGHFSGHVRFMDGDLYKPMGVRRPTLWAIWNDFFHEGVSDRERDRAVDVMAGCPRHVFVALTKRPGRAWCLWHRAMPGNLWVGVSCGNRRSLERDVFLLSEVSCAVRVLSLEPLLEDLRGIRWALRMLLEAGGGDPQRVWGIVGGETGGGARPCRWDWIADLVSEFAEFGVPCFVKQWGSRPLKACGMPMRLQDRKGADSREWPGVLPREFPKVT